MAALLCRARELLCALPLECLVETMRPLPVTADPLAPPFVLGVARVRGTQMPVVDLGALLGARLPPQPARFLSLRLEGRGVILAVEGVVEFVTKPPMPGTNIRHFSGTPGRWLNARRMNNNPFSWCFVRPALMLQ
jgi:purine-binding chemotaxis protein CheW